MSLQQKHNVVVVDDENVMLEIVAEILNQEGYNPHKFSNVADAESFITQNTVSLLLLDVTMPHESGYSFLKRLKENPQFKDLPVIFMTGKSDIEDKVHGFELGAVDYVVKPFHRMDLLMRIKAHIKIIESQSEDKEKLSQLKQAHRALMALPEDLPDARFAVYFKSLLEAGGDFYEVLKIDENRHAYFVADISGHDIATSYIMPAVKALMKQCFKDSNLFHDELFAFNHSVKESIPDGKFITGIMVVIDRKEKSVSIINMGHLPPVIKTADGKAGIVEISGDILGVHDKPLFGFTKLKLDRGDQLFLYTDGLLESPENRQIWSKTLKDLPSHINELCDQEFKDLPAALAQRMNAVNTDSDDVLILAIEM